VTFLFVSTNNSSSLFADSSLCVPTPIVPLFYGGVEAVVLGIYCIVCWKLGMTKAPKDEKICVVVTKTYEILEDESAHRRSSHDEGIEVECHDADGAH